ncbi:MAG: hypothetical protein A2087_10620 [Spirochaetes bacterium GWD1_61_31]|nr:MAG: hypothetical protein A2Y37_00150 [Spirochaetes bacterium GWB1_60_80]OHD32140.1 MAG: hypothetical protein A2004_05055 [Spirochaetes bacterium GWC1_61_12]OHD37125.1 MAG: hypothetical protein A2087_10620 [Spirochaetes bacterium GWD1_61_31]OHD42659.1 MAG: hypothetical protein A2Y35_12145 [Spirochaetes bacterium GWE1_60_18]OHD58540.1 MAG: hypothetical protein A2Y32_08725 [Spirochaetes bacterium GWF1_60_12]HAP43955.1 3'-5' exonuclease [Spirochaetaceae bacterium]
MTAYTLISTTPELASFRAYLVDQSIATVAMDFEGEYNLHVYGEKLCLIQVFDGKRYFAIDPFKIATDELAALLTDTKIAKLFYDANSDSKTVYKQYGFKLRQVVDLKMMVDVLGFEKRGLDAVLQTVLNITVTGKGTFQRHNWTLRPIDPRAVDYALADVGHLFRLETELRRLIAEAGKAAELQRFCIDKAIEYDRVPVPSIMRKPEYVSLRPVQKLLFARILELRDQAARELNWPPNSVFANDVIFQIIKDRQRIGPAIFNARLPEKRRRELQASLLALFDRPSA